MTRRCCIIGATSSLGVILARMLAQQGATLLLIGRDEVRLSMLAADCHARYASDTDYIPIDFTQADDDHAAHRVAACDEVYLLSGTMTGSLDSMMRVNVTGPAMLVESTAEAMQQRGSGYIIIVSSVAGDRGRASNYHYGCTKAALSAYASGLRNRMHAHDVRVITVKPGFMDTPMTWGMRSPLMADRQRVARDILRARDKGKDIVYTPWFWQIIMGIIMHIPERMFKRLSL